LCTASAEFSESIEEISLHHLQNYDAPYQQDAGVPFCAIGNKNAGNSQQNARRERLFIRKSALSGIFYCGFAAGKYYLM
jgi:hypothetical protein